MNYRNKALMDSANGERCVSCGSYGTTVWCHSNEQEHGKGIGIKASDLLGLYLCFHCHSAFDGGMTREEARAFFREHYPKTMICVSQKIARKELKL